MEVIIPFKAGVVKDDDAYSAEGYARDSDKILWVNGRAQWQRGAQKATTGAVSGAARGMHAWADFNQTKRMAIGTHCKLYVFKSARLFDITPIRTSGTYSADPFATLTGSTSVTVSHTAHGAKTGDTVYIGRAAVFAGVQIGGATGTMSAAPFQTISGSKEVLVTLSGHTLATGDFATITNASAVAGITISGAYSVYVVNSDAFLIDQQTVANATMTGGGSGPSYSMEKGYRLTVSGANAYVVSIADAATSQSQGGGSSATFRLEINCGNRNAIAGAGYGVGGYGVGPYGLALQATSQTQPALWTMDNGGQFLYANRYQGNIFRWELEFSQRAATLSGAPAQVNCIAIGEGRNIIAGGCTDTDGTYDPTNIRYSDDEDDEVWDPEDDNLAGQFKLFQGSIVRRVLYTESETLIFTDTTLYAIDYTGNPDELYVPRIIGTNCGLIAPLAVAEMSGMVFWMSPAYQLFLYRGGKPIPLYSPVREWMEGLVSKGQAFKIYAKTDAKFTSVTWHFPSTESGTAEIDKYIRYDYLEGLSDANAGWSVGTWDRTTWHDRGVFTEPMAVSSSGNVFFHDVGAGEDGQPITQFVDWAPFDMSGNELGDGAWVTNLRRLIFNAKQEGNFTVTVTAQRRPRRSVERTKVYNLQPTTEYLDCRLQGRLIGLRIESQSGDAFMRAGDILADISKGPRR